MNCDFCVTLCDNLDDAWENGKDRADLIQNKTRAVLGTLLFTEGRENKKCSVRIT